MIRHSNQTLPQPTAPPSSSNSGLSYFREYASRRRRWLGLVALLVIIIIVVGVVVTAHHYYHEWGGQGWLKSRAQTQNLKAADVQEVYLPLRKVEIREDDTLRFEWNRRSMGSVPFYACGDQQSSCEAYNQPNICCPVQMVCHPTSFTPSEIFCCNSTAASSDCRASKSYPPKCMPNTFQCSGETGGGCCPNGSQCSLNGCLQISAPSIIEATSTYSLTSETTSPIPGSYTYSSSVVGSISSGGLGPGVTTVTNTVTQIPAATATVVKEGEVAQNGAATRGSVVLRLCLPYSCAWVLVCVAALMGML